MPSQNFNPAQLRGEIDSQITELRQLGHRFNPLQLLSRVSFHHLMKGEGGEDASDHNQSEAQVEYLLSLFLAAPFPQTPELPSPKDIQHCIDALNSLYGQATIFYAITAESKSGDKAESEIILQQRLQSLHVRGDAYAEHAKLTFRDIAAPHDPFLVGAFGFGSAQLLEFVEHAQTTINDTIDSAMTRVHDQFSPFFNEGRDAKSDDGQESENATEIEAAQAAIDGFGGPELFEIAPRTQADWAILNALSVEFGGNGDFLSRLPKWVGWPLNSTIISRKPIVKHDGKFYVLHLPLLARNVLSILEGLIQQTSESYWQNTFLRKRDDYVENTAVELIGRALPGCIRSSNLFYGYVEKGEARRAELDGLIQYGDCLLVIEVKASGLSDAGRRGAPESLLTDLTASLGKAYSQAQRVLTLVRSKDEVVFTDAADTEVLRLRIEAFRHVFLISVTREHFASLATRLYTIRKLGLIQGAEWPWAVCLNDLRVICEILDHPALMLHYIRRRLEVNEHPALHSQDELDLFGHFLSAGLYFREDPAMRSGEMVMLDSFTEDLDRFYHERAFGCVASKPTYSLPQRIGELIARLEAARPEHFSSACLDILAYGTEGLEKLEEQVSGCETAFTQRKVRVAGVANVVYTDAPLVLFSCFPFGGKNQEQAVGLARRRKEATGVLRGTLIAWEPPLTSGRIVVYLL